MARHKDERKARLGDKAQRAAISYHLQMSDFNRAATVACVESSDGRGPTRIGKQNFCQQMHQKEELTTAPPERWLKADGSTVSCTEKVKVLEENWEEVKALLQDVLDDAVLMGCTEQQVKAEYKRLIDALQCGFEEQKS